MKKMKLIIIIGIFVLSLIACSQVGENAIGNKNEVVTEIIQKTEKETIEDSQKESLIEEDTASTTKHEKNDKVYNIEEYGQLVEIKEEFTEENGNLYYYYTLEELFVNDAFSNSEMINTTLQQIYTERENEYKEIAESYKGESYMEIPYDYFHLISIELADEEYFSILYNDISYWGGAHPYSFLNGITIDCKTGKEVSASELLGISDDEILEQVSNKMGMDVVATWDDIDFYLTESEIVFFYRMPNYWEDVVFPRRTLD